MAETPFSGLRNPPHGEGPPATVLLVDDEPFNIDLLEQELSGFGLEIRTAGNGREALESVQEKAPDMIFLDLMMPGVDGFGVLERLQEHPEWRGIPVVIVSASSDVENIVRGIEMGATDFLPKPFEPAILQARLNAGLEKKRLNDLEQQYLKSLERELEIGRQIQAGFLPKAIPQPEAWRIEAYFQAAREVAGDFYDVFEVGDGELALLLGDVTDKGVGSALYMALYTSLLRAALMAESLTGEALTGDLASPEERLLKAVRLVNSYICSSHDSGIYASLFFGILDTASGKLRFVSAGHDPPYLLRENTILGQIKPTGPVVGVLEDAAYRVESISLEPGDSLVVYSDGIPDCRNAAGEMFGVERLRDLLQRPASDAFADVVAALSRHLDGASQYDDISLLLVSRDGGKP